MSQLFRECIREVGAPVYQHDPLPVSDRSGNLLHDIGSGNATSATNFDYKCSRHFSSSYTGCKPGKVKPDVSSQPHTQLSACTAFPAAPFIRLSNAAMTTTRRRSASSSKP